MARPKNPTRATCPGLLEVIQLADASGRYDREICESAGVGKNTLSLVRSGERTYLRRHTINMLLVALGVPLYARKTILNAAKARRYTRRPHIPDALMPDWKVLKAHGYTNAEAAKSLGLTYGAPAR